MKKKEILPIWGYWVVGIFLASILALVCIGFVTISRRTERERREKQESASEAERIIRIETNKAKAAVLKAISDEKDRVAATMRSEAQSTPASPGTNQGSSRKISGEWLGAKSEDALKRIVRFSTDGDKEAFSAYCASGILAGEVIVFKGGEEVFIVDTSIFSGTVKVRIKGQVQEYWTVTEAVK